MGPERHNAWDRDPNLSKFLRPTLNEKIEKNTKNSIKYLINAISDIFSLESRKIRCVFLQPARRKILIFFAYEYFKRRKSTIAVSKLFFLHFLQCFSICSKFFYQCRRSHRFGQFTDRLGLDGSKFVGSGRPSFVRSFKPNNTEPTWRSHRSYYLVI